MYIVVNGSGVFGKQVSKYRKQQGLTVAELASILGISLQELEMIEDGSLTDIHMDLMNDLCMQLSVDMGTLVNRSESQI